MRIHNASIAAGVVCAALAAGVVPTGSRGGPAGFALGPATAQAQNFGQRIVTGTVVDASSTAIAGARVFLRDLKSKTIRSYTTTADGHFRFTQVYMAEDHELWAEKDG